MTDACILPLKVDGITLVVDSGTIRPEMAQKSEYLLVKANGHLLIEEEHAYYYYYYCRDNKKIAK